MTELRRPVLLDPARHERAEFESGEPSLDAWLRRYAGQSRRRDTAATWVIADAVDRVVAYASIAMTAIDRSCAPARVSKGSPDPVAALLLGLAVGGIERLQAEPCPPAASLLAQRADHDGSAGRR